MSDQANIEQGAPSKEDAAFETALNLLSDATESLPAIMPRHVDTPTAAILIASHALIAKLDSMEATLCDALHAIRASVDFQATRPDSEVAQVLTSEESELIVATLKADWIKRHPIYVEKKYIATLRRFEILAGL